MSLLFADLGPTKKQSRLRELPPILDNGWRPPQSYPNLDSAVAVAVDVETRETDFEHGPGWARGPRGHIIGFSVGAVTATGARGRWYFPLRHEVEPEYNVNAEQSFAWLKSICQTNVPKVGANLLYDIGWLSEYDVAVNGPLYDCQFAEALLSEDGEVNLDWLGTKYLGEGKASNGLYDWLAAAYGGAANGKQRANLYRAPPRLVGPYGEADADLPLRVMERQLPLLAQQGLMDVFRVECDTIPLWIAMRRAGQYVDVPAAERLYGEIAADVKILQADLDRNSGWSVNVNSSKDLEKLFTQCGIKFPRGKDKVDAQGEASPGNGSFKKEYLQSLDHPAVTSVLTIREQEKVKDTFIDAYILKRNNNGFINCNFHPLRGDAEGTRSGRVASNSPNLQNVPVRSALGKKMRNLFLPDPGHAGSWKGDYSQVEYRSLAHFAVGVGADRLREEYNLDPTTDYHDATYYRVCPFMHWDAADEEAKKERRKPIKNINFGLLYGMGEGKLSRQLKLAPDQAKSLFNGYHSANPYVRETMAAAAQEAEQHGFIRTVLGRKSYFEMWEPTRKRGEDRKPALGLEHALQFYGQDIQRAHLHKAINRKLQGSAGDIIKYAMLKNWKDGVYAEIGVPRLQVHDELLHSVRERSARQEETYRYMIWNMENALRLRVPLKFDSGYGVNWGSIKA
jgi:DNA polymerase I-like protein with 3'-5' exonuclease and polymerase domains